MSADMRPPRSVDSTASELARPPAAHARAALALYPERQRSLLAPLAAAHPRLCDLLVSFPAAAVALASPRRSRRTRAHALALVLDGAPLRDIGAVLGVPTWLRRLPPQALPSLSARISDNDDAFFGVQIAGVLADGAPTSPRWLKQVLAARRRGGDVFAIWIAQQLHDNVRFSSSALSILAAFAFFSAHPHTLAGQYAVRRFHPRMSPFHANASATTWMLSLLLALKACSAPPCTFTCEVSGLHIAPLQTFAELCCEGRIMRNCLGDYGPRVLSDRARVFSVRRGGAPVAALEIRPGVRGVVPPRVIQLKGPDNSAAAHETAASVAVWLRHAHTCSCVWIEPAPIIDDALWREVWAPYVTTFPRSRLFRAAPADPLERLLAPLQRVPIAVED